MFHKVISAMVKLNNCMLMQLKDMDLRKDSIQLFDNVATVATIKYPSQLDIVACNHATGHTETTVT